MTGKPVQSASGSAGTTEPAKTQSNAENESTMQKMKGKVKGIVEKIKPKKKEQAPSGTEETGASTK